MVFLEYYAEQVDDKSELIEKFEELDGVLSMSILKQRGLGKRVGLGQKTLYGGKCD